MYIINNDRPNPKRYCHRPTSSNVRRRTSVLERGTDESGTAAEWHGLVVAAWAWLSCLDPKETCRFVGCLRCAGCARAAIEEAEPHVQLGRAPGFAVEHLEPIVSQHRAIPSQNNSNARWQPRRTAHDRAGMACPQPSSVQTNVDAVSQHNWGWDGAIFTSLDLLSLGRSVAYVLRE